MMGRLSSAMMMATSLILAACESKPKADMAGALADYDAHRYDAAMGQAAEVQRESSGPQQDEAAYLAGLSGYRLEKYDEAERHFLVSADAADVETAGQSRAMLGLIRMKQNRPSEAAAHFAAASGMLQGEDARKAAHQAALAYEQAGNESAAALWTTKAGGFSRSDRGNTTTARGGGSASQAQVAPSGRGFSLQVGAYQERSRAQRAADDVAPLAQQHGLGPMRIVPSRDSRGRQLYLVQFGWFESRTAAAAARQRLGKLEYIVAQAAS